jgi:hypothetical protein
LDPEIGNLNQKLKVEAINIEPATGPSLLFSLTGELEVERRFED